MGLTRRQDWPKRFAEAVIAKQTVPFEYGTHDCCLSVCDLVLAMTDVDMAKKLRGYKTYQGAKNRLGKYGGIPGLAEMIAKEHSVPETTARRAGKGDVVLVQTERMITLGIVDTSGVTILVPRRPVGWAYLDKSHGIKFWRI